MSASILYVGSDPAQRLALEAQFRDHPPFRTVSDPPSALSVLGEHEISVLLIDCELGRERARPLLDRVKEEWPDTIRLLLCTPNEMDDALAAVGSGRLHNWLYRGSDLRHVRIGILAAHDRYLANRRIRELEKRLFATERLYSLGVIAAGIAHEIRNPLGALQANLEMTRETFRYLADHGSDCEQIADRVRAAVEAVEDCSNAAASILEITRSVELTTRASTEEEIDLREVVQLAVRSIRGELRGKGEVRVETSPDLPTIKGSRNKLGQVVLNLVLNALEATRASQCPLLGKVTVRIRTNAAQVELEVEDNGAGIEPSVLLHIFDPFFTTKSSGGTGLGLVISRRIVEEHGGRIEVFSKPGEGSRFLVSLPAERS